MWRGMSEFRADISDHGNREGGKSCDMAWPPGAKETRASCIPRLEQRNAWVSLAFYCGVYRWLFLAVSPHKTLRITWFLVKKQKQNRPFPQWIWMKTGKSDTSPRGGTGEEPQGITHEMAHIFLLHEGHVLLSYHAINVTTTWIDLFYGWKWFFCYPASAPVGCSVINMWDLSFRKEKNKRRRRTWVWPQNYH